MSEDIRSIGTINRLITYFSKVLDWQIDEEDFEDIEDISYDFEAEDLGLKEEAFAKIKSLRQLQPLVDGQKWGIFSIEFDSKKFEVTALRKVLSGLIPKKRNSADHAVWSQKDLLFLCFWGEDSNRTIGIAHFEDKEKGLPQIKMIYCAPAIEDTMQIRQFETRLSNLSWPANVLDIEAWHEKWSSAFTTGYRENIHDASTLTIRLAVEAQGIRNRILETLKVETKGGYVHQLFQKFKDTLIHDMDETQFADMYAQTVVYGLFSARCMDNSQDDFSAEEAIECIPNTNPFLKSLMRECLGVQGNSKLSFDELEIGNVVDLLLHTKTDSIIQDFNRQTGGGKEDPVIHFYEEFLTAYDKTQKVDRGVFYTPQPVVNFIVRAVDEILKMEYEFSDGLASIDTKKTKYLRDSKKRTDGYYRTQVEDTKDVPAIQILDPSTGTGTFLRQTILQINENFIKKNKQMTEIELKELWNNYVSKHLLPRLFGFELMMAPYAVAHMKLAMVLKDTGYSFDSNERLNVFLSNTLEEPGNSDGQLSFFDDPLASESVSANAVKKNNGINIVIGNPPYAVSTSNKNQWIENLLQPYKTEPGGREKLKEQKYSIDADEIKFLRYAQCVVDNAGEGVIAFINPHAFLDKPTFRGVRWQLLHDFDLIYIINLHGNSNHQEKTPDGKKDENVFDIQQGVCINIFVKKKKKTNSLAKVFYKDLYGERADKYDWLNKNALENIDFVELEPQEPYYMLVPFTGEGAAEYYDGFCLEHLFTKHLEGIQSGKDKLVIQKNKEDLDLVINDLLTLDTEAVREKYQLGKDGRDWKVSRAQDDIKNNYPNEGQYFKLALRPFDERCSYYTGNSSGFIKCCRNEVSKEMVGRDNIAFTLTRNAMPQKPYSNFHIVKTCVVGRYIGDFSTSTQVFPLFSYVPITGDMKRIGNVDKVIIDKICAATGLKCVDFASNSSEFDLVMLADYIFAVLNSAYYQAKYKEQLCRDFPFIPYPRNSEMFFKLVTKGERLRKAHLDYEIDITQDNQFAFDGNGDDIITGVKRMENKVYVNKNQYINDVPEEIWEYWIGGHQIAQKWLKERKNEKLSNEDKIHYCKILGVIKCTIRISGEVDEILKEYV